MKLTLKQQDAFDFFGRSGYLVLEGPRRSGKTMVLLEIVRRNSKKTVGVKCLSRKMFDTFYKEFKNCKYNKEDVDILIGDEVFIEPTPKKKTACAMTRRWVVKRFPIPEYFPEGELEKLRSVMDPAAFDCEFGQYL